MRAHTLKGGASDTKALTVRDELIERVQCCGSLVKCWFQH